MKNINFFDADWYVKTYPDVANAGVDPLKHFIQHGRREGRIPCNLPALALERQLWSNAFSPEESLKQLDVQASVSNVNGIYASRVLSSFYLFTESAKMAIKYIERIWDDFESAQLLFSVEELFLLRFESYFKDGNLKVAREVAFSEEWPKCTSKLLAREMVATNERRFSALNEIYVRQNLIPLTHTSAGGAFDSLVSRRPNKSLLGQLLGVLHRKTVSVVVPAYNAASTISTCLASLCSQTWKNIEIIVVNDASTDSTKAVVETFCEKYPFIKVINNSVNKGAYASRNIGMQCAVGDFLTVMDADDWAHPQKIEKQTLPFLFKRKLKGTLSHWVRSSNDLHFSTTKSSKSWVHRNVSSLLIKRDVYQTLGGWDEIAANADTEFYERMKCVFGKPSVLEVMPDIPLSFGRSHSSSLTQSKDTHLVTQYGGVRKQYMDFARIWHRHSTELYNPSVCNSRPFPVPPTLLKQANKENDEQFKRWSDALDEQWYSTVYEDVNILGLGLHEHFWRTGEANGRYPSLLFCPEAYRYKFNVDEKESPTWHALNSQWDFNSPVEIGGKQKHTDALGQKVALFGHSVSENIFGAERSFIDIARALHKANLDVTIFLPSCANTSYVEELKCYSSSIIFLPLPWVKGTREVFNSLVEYLVKCFISHGFKSVYVNTIMLLEPLLAAKKATIPSVVHIRELVEFDPDLAKSIGETPEQTHSRIENTADFYIANSQETANWINKPSCTEVIYNCIDSFEESSTRNDKNRTVLKVCMLSSNVKKKGVDDFFEIAAMCRGNKKIEFNLYGPITADVQSAKRRYGSSNIHLAGYIENPKVVLVDNDVVLGLSNFKESFGRTIAEAMAIGRIVIAYDWGAVGELLDADSGFLVEYKDKAKIVSILNALVSDKKGREQIETAAVKRANSLFSPTSFDSKLGHYMLSLLENAASSKTLN
ncbi:glycosyltransferase [Alteromonas australica]|uniref:glycosyltransferase n=1 Tax=Alteromonas australica TaxID=589873 RepID=UPI002357D7A9|nr:glycosyltransferase [Alteromonas australica]